MGKLTGELKSFARKSSGELHVTAIRKVVDNALFLLEHRIERGAVTIVDEVDEDATAWCDPNRLEQVLINLIGNALDAMEGHADRRLHLKAVRSGEKVVVEIRDNGPGLPDELL